ncbi:hypothetical protein NL676_038414 [Syzygium grande]|nr:hypothetical protein NL676_038414 [Syzygium grande]
MLKKAVAMDKRRSIELGSQKIPPRPKISGTSKLEINNNNASMLIGSIVEKGVSEIPKTKTLAPTPPPRATVLPFPVARHCSHGPVGMCRRKGSVGVLVELGARRSIGVQLTQDRMKITDSDDHDEDAREDGKLTASERIAALARPVQRMEKKELNLHNWRELIAGMIPLTDRAGIQNAGPRDGSLWSAWTDRVESVLKLRFSLDGNVIQSELDMGTSRTLIMLLKTDILRTEGNPGAAGYTIKEVVALTRSVDAS